MIDSFQVGQSNPAHHWDSSGSNKMPLQYEMSQMSLGCISRHPMHPNIKFLQSLYNIVAIYIYKSDKRNYHFHQISSQLYNCNFKGSCNVVNLSHDAPLHEHQECLSHIIYIKKVTGLEACPLNSAVWKRTEVYLLR